MPRKKTSWRLSDQTNSELPVGNTYIDIRGQIGKLVVQQLSAGYVNVWPENNPEYDVRGAGVNLAISEYDKRVSRDRMNHRMKKQKNV